MDLHRFETLSHQKQLLRLQNLAEEVLSRYGLQKAQSLLLQYEDNAVYRITTHTGERFVLRVSAIEGQNAEEQRSEMQWLTALRQDTDLLVPEPVPNLDGDLITTAICKGFPEPRQCVLLRWVPGDPPTPTIQLEVFERIGAFTARLHRHAEHFVLPTEFVRPLWDWERLFGSLSVLNREKSVATLIPHQREVLEMVSMQIQQKQDFADTSTPHWGLIHADLHRDNILLDDGNVGVIDFDDCGWGFYLYDLASVLDSFYRRIAKSPEDYLLIRESYLKGYDQIRALPANVEELLKIMKAMRDIVTLNFILGSQNTNVQTWGSQRVNQIFMQLEAYLEDSPTPGI